MKFDESQNKLNLEPGTVVKHYRLIKRLGQGQSGIVFKAEDIHLLRPVAIKFLLVAPFTPVTDRAVTNKVPAIATINHPALCTIYEVDQTHGQPFVVMEYLQGQTLRTAIDSGELTEENAIKYAKILLDIVRIAYESGRLHHPIELHNVFICHDQSVKVTDFGLAFFTPSNSISHDKSTSTGMTVAHHQLMNHENPDTRIRPDETLDSVFNNHIRSLGGVLKEMLQLEVENHEEKEVDSRARRLFSKKRRYHAARQRLYYKMTTSKPNESYRSFTEMHDDLNKLDMSQRNRQNLFWNTVPVKSRSVLILMIGFTLFASGAWMLWKSQLYSRNNQELYYLDKYKISTHSRNALDWFERGQKAWWRYDLKRAIDYFEIAVRIDSTFVYAHTLNGVILRWEDYHERSSAAFEKAERYGARAADWEKLMVEGYAGYHSGNLEKSHQAFKTLTQRYPDLVDAYLGQALMYEVEKEFEKAISATQNVVEIDSLHISAHSNIADLYINLEQYEQAEKYAQKTLQLIRVSKDTLGIENAYDLLGNIYRLSKKYPQAIAHFRKALEISPLQRINWALLAETLAINKQIPEAEAVLFKALDLPFKAMDKAELYAKLGYVYSFSGQYRKAIEAFENAREISYDSQRYDQFLAFSQDMIDVYYMLNNADAIMDVKRVVDRLNENQIETFKNSVKSLYTFVRIRFALLKGRKTDLLEFISDCMQQPLSPEFKIAMFAQALMELGQEEEALQWFQTHEQQAMQKLGDEKLIYDYYYALLLYLNGDYDRALFYGNRIMDQATISFNTDLHYIKVLALLADIYLALDNQQMAEWYSHEYSGYWQFADKSSPLH